MNALMYMFENGNGEMMADTGLYQQEKEKVPILVNELTSNSLFIDITWDNKSIDYYRSNIFLKIYPSEISLLIYIS